MFTVKIVCSIEFRDYCLLKLTDTSYFLGSD